MALTYDQATRIRDLTNMALAEAGHEQASAIVDVGGGWYSVSVPADGVRATALASVHVFGPDRPMLCTHHAVAASWNVADGRPRSCCTAAQLVADPTFDCRLAPSARVVLGSLGVPSGAGAGIGHKR